MSRLDILYRAFADYRKNTSENRECANNRRLFARANSDGDTIENLKTECYIEDDWIKAIDEGLKHIGNAIAEERQFIRSNGEVVPIEKVKKVSKESVEHLARHSNYLTKYTEGEDIIPDQLYTVELLSDYAVYENRFLYMVLCYLRDFITVRYDKIKESANTYNSKLSLKKDFHSDSRKVSFNVFLDDTDYNDNYTFENNQSKDKIEKIGDLLNLVASYLTTPLMEEVAKTPMLKPPIVETNVLKMNKNFHGALEVYYFVTAYDKDGYTLTTTTKRIKPFDEDYADKFAEAAELLSFLTYEYSMNVGGTLKNKYLDEEKRRREEEENKLREQLAKLRKNIRDSGVTPEEYMLMLEKRNLRLENDSILLKTAMAEIEKKTAELADKDLHIGRLITEKEELIGSVEEGKRQLEEQNARHAEEIENINAAHSGELASLEQRRAEEIESVNRSHRDELERVRQSNETQKEEMQKGFAAQIAEYERKLDDIGKESAKHQSEIAQASEKYNKLDERYALLSAKYNAIRREHGLLTDKDDFTSKESFNQLERQYHIFTKFFKEEWRKTKKQIRKEVFAAAAESEKAESGKAAAGKKPEGADKQSGGKKNKKKNDKTDK
ncbi:MAG: hypothetical protein ACI4MH_01045 [Candidatus Coproplasma sp.]